MHLPLRSDWGCHIAEDGIADGDYLNDERWTAMRRIGESAGWLVDPREASFSFWHSPYYFMTNPSPII